MGFHRFREFSLVVNSCLVGITHEKYRVAGRDLVQCPITFFLGGGFKVLNFGVSCNRFTRYWCKAWGLQLLSAGFGLGVSSRPLRVQVCNKHLVVVQDTCPRNGHNVSSLFGQDLLLRKCIPNVPFETRTSRTTPMYLPKTCMKAILTFFSSTELFGTRTFLVPSHMNSTLGEKVRVRCPFLCDVFFWGGPKQNSKPQNPKF